MRETVNSARNLDVVPGRKIQISRDIKAVYGSPRFGLPRDDTLPPILRNRLRYLRTRFDGILSLQYKLRVRHSFVFHAV